MNILDEIGKLAASAILVKEEVGPDVAAWRMEICKGCDMLEKRGLKCGVCGCYLEVKVFSNVNLDKRGRSEITHCPLGRWDDLEVANHYRQINGLPPLDS